AAPSPGTARRRRGAGGIGVTTLHVADTPVQPGAAPPAAQPAPPRRGPLLTPRRSNVILLLIAALLLPTMTVRAMPLLPGTYPLAVAQAAAIAVGALSLNMLLG